jgi:hypothetical protein
VSFGKPIINLAPHLLPEEIDELQYGRFAGAVQSDQARELGQVELKPDQRFEIFDRDRL